MLLRMFPLTGLLMLAACTTPAMPPATGQCNAQGAQAYVGKVATTTTVEAARKAAGAALSRTIKPGQMVTMDYREERLNVDVDASNVITGFRCG